MLRQTPRVDNSNEAIFQSSLYDSCSCEASTMFAFSKPSFPKEKRRAVTRTILILLTLCAIWIGLTAGDLRELYRSAALRRNAEQQLRVVRKEIEDLERQWALLRESDFESERRIRAMLMLKPDEKVIYLKEVPESE